MAWKSRRNGGWLCTGCGAIVTGRNSELICDCTREILTMSRDQRASVDWRQQGGRSNDGATQRVFRAACEIMADTLTDALLGGSYELMPLSKVGWRPKRNQKISLRPSRDHEIRVRIRPGNNDTAWEYVLCPLGGLTWDHVRDTLAAHMGPEETDMDHEQVNGHAKARTHHEARVETSGQVTLTLPALAPVNDQISMADTMARMLDAIKRATDYTARIAQLRRTVEVANVNIATLTASRDQAELDIMGLEDAMANDKELAVAKQFASAFTAMANVPT